MCLSIDINNQFHRQRTSNKLWRSFAISSVNMFYDFPIRHLLEINLLLNSELLRNRVCQVVEICLTFGKKHSKREYAFTLNSEQRALFRVDAHLLFRMFESQILESKFKWIFVSSSANNYTEYAIECTA